MTAPQGGPEGEAHVAQEGGLEEVGGQLPCVIRKERRRHATLWGSQEQALTVQAQTQTHFRPFQAILAILGHYFGPKMT